MTEPLTSRVFAEGMALLAERFNREISPGLSRIYAHALKDLGADLFVAGIERAVAELTFFPSAKEIRELARPGISAEVRAGEVLAGILASGFHTPHGRRYDVDKIEELFGEAARRAFVAIGGARRVIGMTDEAFPFVLRDFAAAFAEYDRELAARGAVKQITAGNAAPAIAGGSRPKYLGAGPSPVADIIAAAIPAGTFTEVEK